MSATCIINKFILKFYGRSRYPIECPFLKTEINLCTLIYFTRNSIYKCMMYFNVIYICTNICIKTFLFIIF